MPHTDLRERPSWLTIGPATLVAADAADLGGRLDIAWGIWGRLRMWDRRYAFVVDTVLAAGLFILSGSAGMLIPGHHTELGFITALTIPLVLRRRAPIAVFAALAVVALVQFLVAAPLLADAALLVALYTVAAESHWVHVVAASVILEVGVIMATVHWIPTGNHFKSFVFLSGLAFAALLAGIVVRALRRQMALLAERTLRLERDRDQQASLAAAAERARIAREMHDVVSHNIQVMVTLADAANRASATDPARAAEAMEEVSGTGRQALTDMRRMLGVLRDSGATGHRLDDAVLTPQPGLSELEALFERVRSTGLAVDMTVAGQPFALSGAAELTVYRIIQEALTNALKHAFKPRSVTIAITYREPEISVDVTDDGLRADGNFTHLVEGGHGMTGMAERAAAFGGTLQAGPAPKGGWKVAATLHGCRAPVPA